MVEPLTKEQIEQLKQAGVIHINKQPYLFVYMDSLYTFFCVGSKLYVQERDSFRTVDAPWTVLQTHLKYLFKLIRNKLEV
jgi:hypothetical protein